MPTLTDRTAECGEGQIPSTPAQGRTGDDFVPDAVWFETTRPLFGNSVCALSIGPLTFSLEGLSAAQARAMERRFAPFVVPREAAGGPSDLTIRLTRAGVDGFLAVAPGRQEVYRLERREHGRFADAWSYEFACRLAPARKSAELALVDSDGARFERGLENCLRLLTARYVLEHGGLLLHGAGVTRGGRAYVFFGPSGSGKTTVTALSPHDGVLSDDLTLLVRDGGSFRAAGIPFGMAHHRVPHTRAAFPVAGLYRLVQSRSVRRTPIAPGKALSDLVACLPFVMEERTSALRALEAAARLATEVPAYRLEFRKDDAFWGVIEER